MSKHESEIVRLAAEHVFTLFRRAEPDNALVYHGYNRTRDLVDATKKIAKGNKLEPADKERLECAARSGQHSLPDAR